MPPPVHRRLGRRRPPNHRRRATYPHVYPIPDAAGELCVPRHSNPRRRQRAAPTHGLPISDAAGEQCVLTSSQSPTPPASCSSPSSESPTPPSSVCRRPRLQMERSWINARQFSKAHLDGVSEFMEFVNERFGVDEEILCPCRKCLNRVRGHRGLVQDHLYIHGMASTYDRWIYHGEPSQVEIDRSVSHMDDNTGFSTDGGIDEDEEDPNDRLPDMLSDLYTAAQGPEQSQAQGPEGGMSMFAAVLEEMKKELYPGCASFSRSRRRNFIELRYNSNLSDRRTVVLFRCDWFDTDGRKGTVKDDGLFKSIHHGILWYKNDPFILAAQATKVFYLKDNASKKNESWKLVQKFTHRHLWNVAENENEERPSSMGLSYQDDVCEDFHVNINQENLENEDPNNEDSTNVEASVVDEIRRQKEKELEEDDLSSDEEDETVQQYMNDDNESPPIPDYDYDDTDSE